MDKQGGVLIEANVQLSERSLRIFLLK